MRIVALLLSPCWDVARGAGASSRCRGSLGMRWGGDESALPHSLQKKLFFFCPELHYSKIIKKDVAKSEIKEAREELQKDVVSFFFNFIFSYVTFI